MTIARLRAAPTPRGTGPLVLLVAILLVACGRGTDLDAQNQARRALRAAGQPVLLVLEGNPFEMDQARLNGLISSEMADGISGMSTRFTTSADRAAAPEPRLVVVLNPLSEPAPATLCAGPQSVATAPAIEQMRIVAAFCQQDQVLGTARTEAAVAGPTDQRFRRLLWRTASQVFPDDYEDTYGFGILPRSIDFGLGGVFGK
ncbi:MAG: hypothetical protein ACREJ5_20175 [Geminicoccaceae bacterium]